MKRVAILTFFISVFFLNLNSVFSQDLSANIMRRVNAANLELDKAEEQIRTGKSELAPRKVKGAQKEYDTIFKYYKGSFNPNHPTLLTLKERIENISNQLSQGTKQTPKTPVQRLSKDEQRDVWADIHRRIDAADRELLRVNQEAAKGERDNHALGKARQEYANIFNYYKGKFDPANPEIVALKKRIDDAEQAMKIGSAGKNATAPLESNSAAVEDLPENMGQDLISIALSLSSLENRLDTAKHSGFPDSYLYGLNYDLNSASDKFKRFNELYKGRFDSNHVAYKQVEKRLKKDRAAVAAFEAKVGSKK